MYFNSSKIFTVLGRFRIGARIHIRPWVHSWLNRAVGLGFIPKDDSETCHHNFDPPRRGWLPCFGIPIGIIWIGTWKTLHTRPILHAPGAISVHDSVSLSELRTRDLRSGAECSSDLPTAGPSIIRCSTAPKLANVKRI